MYIYLCMYTYLLVAGSNCALICAAASGAAAACQPMKTSTKYSTSSTSSTGDTYLY